MVSQTWTCRLRQRGLVFISKKPGLTSITCHFEVACENRDTGNLCGSSLPSSTNDISLPAQCTIESDLLKDPTGELYKTCRQVPLLYLLNLLYFTTQAKMYNSICLFWSGWERQLHLPCFQVLLKKCHRRTLSRVGMSHPPPLTLEKNVFPALILTQTWIQTIRMPCQLEDLLNIAWSRKKGEAPPKKCEHVTEYVVADQSGCHRCRQSCWTAPPSSCRPSLPVPARPVLEVAALLSYIVEMRSFLLQLNTSALLELFWQLQLQW